MAAGVYKTDDLALSVCLAIAGFSYELENLTDHQVVWVFTIPEEKDELFDGMLEQFDAWEHQVEPRKFASLWAQMRREMFTKIPARPARTDRRPAPAS